MVLFCTSTSFLMAVVGKMFYMMPHLCLVLLPSQCCVHGQMGLLWNIPLWYYFQQSRGFPMAPRQVQRILGIVDCFPSQLKNWAKILVFVVEKVLCGSHFHLRSFSNSTHLKYRLLSIWSTVIATYPLALMQTLEHLRKSPGLYLTWP